MISLKLDKLCFFSFRGNWYEKLNKHKPVAKKTHVVRKTSLKPLPAKKPRLWQNDDFYKPEQILYIPDGDKYVHVFVERTSYMLKSFRTYGFITYPLATKCYKAENINL